MPGSDSTSGQPSGRGDGADGGGKENTLSSSPPKSSGYGCATDGEEKNTLVFLFLALGATGGRAGARCCPDAPRSGLAPWQPEANGRDRKKNRPALAGNAQLVI
jgi:hypothetical protein